MGDEPTPPSKPKRRGRRRAPKPRRKSSAYLAIDSYAKWCLVNKPALRRITVALTERYVRTVMGLRKRAPLQWKGLELVCIGSPAVRLYRMRVCTKTENAAPQTSIA